MSSCCDKNPLQRSGINRVQRLLPALQPDYVSVDERDYANWIFFAEEFSRYLKFFDTTDTVAGDWKTFFTSDISAILGSIAVQDPQLYRQSIKRRFDDLKKAENAGNLNLLKQKLKELFSGILSLSKALDVYLLKLPAKDPDEVDFVFRGTLLNFVKNKLAPALRRLLSYYRSVDAIPATDLDYLLDSNLNGWTVLNREVVHAEVIIGTELNPATFQGGEGLINKEWWVGGAADWDVYVGSISADSSIFGDPAWTDQRRIIHAANHNLFSSIFDQYLQVYSKIVQLAEKTLLQTLESWDAHPAHYTLFLSFLKLFKFAQAGANSITKRHLDFYYKEVLRLKLKEAQPNHAHVLIELAKQKDDHALKSETEFKAGKDGKGNDVFYALDKETTFNKAKAAVLKTVYQGNKQGKDDELDPTTNIISVNNKARLLASPVTNSDDGIGGKLKSPNKEWHPYGNKKYKDGSLIDVAMPNAQIGFAVASHYLYLSEGERKIYLRLATTDNSTFSTASIECFITTEKEWYKIEPVTQSVVTLADADGNSSYTGIEFILHGDEPPVTNYVAAVHGGTYNVAVPIIKIYLKNEEDSTQYQYDILKNIQVTKIAIKVQVGSMSAHSQTGLKQLLLSSDFGPIDASKPFQPFGAIPAVGNRFVLGSKELFTKKQTSVYLNFEWKGADSFTYGNLAYGTTPDGNSFPNIAVKNLSGGIWETLSAHEEIFINSGSNTSSKHLTPRTAPLVLPDSMIVDYAEPYGVYDINSKKGYAAIQLTEDFGHKNYQDALIVYLINKANKVADADNPKPVEPYTPIVQSLYLSYTSSTIEYINVNDVGKFDERGVHFFHIYPFGEGEQHAWLAGTATLHLLPQFIPAAINGSFAEFYIGFEKLQGLQSVNVLFQVMEGSSDPLVNKPEDHIKWSFLSNNKWVNFTKQEISDGTADLVQSGIISFIIPEAATTNNTILPAGYLWLRGAVAEAAEAVCKLLTVDAQAATVTFNPTNNAENFLDTALPANTISKLKLPDSSVKKTVQPYSSFGGRAKETSEEFYVRISERLRHKARAITIWDYEHLVLEAFPSIHKVKCLNHTKFDVNEDTNQMEYIEVAPGYVTLITIPSLVNRNDTNPLRPYTNQNLLTEIEKFLKKKISCHVKLRVKNPRFEEIAVSFKLKLAEGYDDFTFYSNLLKEEITQFLTPWAYNSDIDIQFGGKIYKSTIIDFIEERPYVDFITDVLMSHDQNPDNEDAGDCEPPVVPANPEFIEASTARSILVSVPAVRHFIGPVPAGDPESELSCPGLIITTSKIG